jgi:hypothetical protein
MSHDQQEYDFSFMDDNFSANYEYIGIPATSKNPEQARTSYTIMEPFLGNAAGTTSKRRLCSLSKVDKHLSALQRIPELTRTTTTSLASRHER